MRSARWLVLSYALASSGSAFAAKPFLQPEDLADLKADTKDACIVAGQINADLNLGHLAEVRLATQEQGTYMTSGANNAFAGDGFAFVLVPKGPFRITLIKYEKPTGNVSVTFKQEMIVTSFGSATIVATKRGDAPNELSGTCNGGFIWLGAYKASAGGMAMPPMMEKIDDKAQEQYGLNNLKRSLKGRPWEAEVDHPAANTPLPKDQKVARDNGPAPRPPRPKIGFQVVVLDHGAEPRKELAYAPAEGSKHNATLTLITGARPGTSQPLPRISWTVDTTVVKGNATAPLRYNYVVTKTGFEKSDAMGDTIAKNLTNGHEGITGFVSFDEHGENGENDHKFPPGKEPKFGPPVSPVSQIANTVVPLPADPIGIGATWRGEMTASRPTFTYVQWSTYKLVGFEGNLAKISIQVVGDTRFPKPIQMPVNGKRENLVASRMTGSGEAKVDLSSMTASYYKVVGQSVLLFAPPGGAGDPIPLGAIPAAPSETVLQSK